MKKWYVLQVFAGYEDQVVNDLQKAISRSSMQDSFGDIVTPSAKVKSMFTAQQEESERLFPGYVLLEMEFSPETFKLVKSVPRILKFLGGKDPVPLSQKEVQKIKATLSGEVEVVSEEREFVEGAEVEIASGPFAGFVGVIESVDLDAKKMTVMVSIFGRMTPVDLSFDQIKR